MNKKQYRALLIASVIVGFSGAFLDLIFPGLLPDGIHQAQNAHDASFSIAYVMLSGVVAIVEFGCYLVSIYGLYRFRSWAPRLALIVVALTLLYWPFTGCLAQSGFAISLNYLASYLWGAVVVLPFFEPVKTYFKKQEDIQP